MPKVLICGRGGSGKSTLVALLAKKLASRNEVLVVDADESNLGLPAMLGGPAPEQSVMDFLGGRPAVSEKLLGSIRSGGGEKTRFFEDEVRAGSLPREMVGGDSRLPLVRIGKIEHAMEGCACPMGAAARSFLSNLVADGDSWVIVDTEAGIEHFGRGVLEGVDLVVMVVDPSHEALLLVDKVKELSSEAGKPFGIVINRAEGSELEFLKDALAAKGLEPMARIPFSETISRSNLTGEPVAAEEAEEGLEELIKAMEASLA